MPPEDRLGCSRQARKQPLAWVRVIHEVDETLRALIRRDALAGTDIDVAFDAPTKDWSSRRNAPTIDLYLYDIREDVRRREVGRLNSRGEDGFISARMQPPRWFKLSYLLTAWTQRPEDEHRLLSACLACFLRQDRIPPELAAGSLGQIRLPMPYTIALPPPEDRALSDVWSALGGELKPSLDLVVTAPFDLTRDIEAGPPVMEVPRFRLGGGPATEDTAGMQGAPGGSTGPNGGSNTGSQDQDGPNGSKESARTGTRSRRKGSRADDKPTAGSPEPGQSETAGSQDQQTPRALAAEERSAGMPEGRGRIFRIREIE